MKRSILLAVVTFVFLVSCGEDGNPALDSDGHNTPDINFAKNMIPHHEQAIEMAKLADTRAADVEVRSLADAIEAAQTPEIDALRGWLTAWDQEESDGMAGMDHSADSGMMSEDEMRSLSASSGAAFDRMFLEMMIRHHQGAVSMANDEVKFGLFADAKFLAGRIVRSQTAEIEDMRNVLARLSGAGQRAA